MVPFISPPLVVRSVLSMDSVFNDPGCCGSGAGPCVGRCVRHRPGVWTVPSAPETPRPNNVTEDESDAAFTCINITRKLALNTKINHQHRDWLVYWVNGRREGGDSQEHWLTWPLTPDKVTEALYRLIIHSQARVWGQRSLRRQTVIKRLFNQSSTELWSKNREEKHFNISPNKTIRILI